MSEQKHKKRKRALVLSGGGSTGAFAGGIIQHLLEDPDKDYDLYVGTSTGSLLAPLTSIREISTLKEGYTNITSKDIFSHDPFNKDGSLKILNMFYRGVTGKKTFGESENLKNIIRGYFKPKHFDRLIKEEKEVVVTVANLTDERLEYKSSLDPGMTYEDFCDWLWAACNPEVFTSIMNKNGNEYADGAIFQHIPAQTAIDHGATEMDIIVLAPEGFGVVEREKVDNVIHYYHKVMRMMQRQIAKYNLTKLDSKGRDVDINIYYTPYRLTENNLIFNKEEMIKWWEEGYIHAQSGNYKKYRVTKSNVFKEVDN